ncbi:hypothetical protein NDU88_006398 [Pleurodeles waltl]|uniref:Uncharacterized protein n=1 Tax=Pleurodeles waltl TaxID=8319 RepID=A0AAV7NV03_PLEWA|nr:hypothetical protein NDU88_006398 [Pleurodeles waltl]
MLGVSLLAVVAVVVDIHTVVVSAAVNFVLNAAATVEDCIWRACPRWRRARTLLSELRRPEVKSTPEGFLRPGEGPKESRAAPAVCGGRPQDSIGAAERRGWRPGPRGGPLSGGLLSLTPGGPGPWRAWFERCELRDRGGGCDPRLHGRFRRGGRPCTRDQRGGWRPMPPTLAPLGGAD